MKRQGLSRHHPVHVTLRLAPGVPGLRRKALGRLVFGAFAVAKDRLGIRLVQFSVQSDHLHLLVEAADRAALSRGMQGLCIRLARRLNSATGRSGKVFADRYHAHVLTNPLEVKRALSYILNNYRHHLAQRRSRAPFDWADPYSSADFFDGFAPLPGGRRPIAEFALGRDPPVVPPGTWLLRTGWRRHGPIALHVVPG